MKYLLTLSLILIGYLTSFSQTDTNAVPFVSYWAKGDSYDFKVTKIKQQWKGDQLIKNDTNAYTANFLVLDSTETSYKIKWSYEADLMSSYQIPTEMLEKFSDYTGMDVIYTTTELGEFIEIENWEEISEMMNDLFNDLIDVLAKDDPEEKESVRKVLAPIIAIYQSKEGIELMAYKELQFIHFPFGFEFTIGDTIEYEDLLPNMLGGDPIKAPTKLYLDDVDFDDSYCSLVQEMTLDPEDTRQLLLSFFKRLNLEDNKLNEMLENSTIEVTDSNVYNFYYYPGVPEYIETQRTTIIDIDNKKAVRKDILQIELL